MTAPWMKYQFDQEERKRMNEIEDWAVENEDEIAPRIVYLESLVKNYNDRRNEK